MSWVLGCHSSQDSDVPITGFSVDTRTLQPGDIYFALPGAKVDGHHFLVQAAEKGASAAVVSRNFNGNGYGLPLLCVGDTLKALQELSKNVLSCFPQIKIVAITGSVGKTTTKDFTATLLREKYRVSANPGSYNSQIGMCLTILNHLKGDEEVFVLEMSMTHPGNISRLVDIPLPILL